MPEKTLNSATLGKPKTTSGLVTDQEQTPEKHRATHFKCCRYFKETIDRSVVDQSAGGGFVVWLFFFPFCA